MQTARHVRTTALAAGAVASMLWPVTPGLAADPPGLAVYREHCLRCHGRDGAGTPDAPEPLTADRSIDQLAATIEQTMPLDDPAKVTGEAAREVAAYILLAFSPDAAHDRTRPPRVELLRLTVRQYRSVMADLIGSFRDAGPGVSPQRGLKGRYFRGRGSDRDARPVYEQVDPRIDFRFGIEGPDPERFEPNRFTIRWTGSIVPKETGLHEFVIRSSHSVKLSINRDHDEPPLIDASVTSNTTTEHRAGIFLLGGRVYPLRLDFSKANQGVDNNVHESVSAAAIRLLWQQPHGILETVPDRVLIPYDSPRSFVLTTPFPPDDESLGYERGAGVSPEWFAATTAAAAETADHVLDRIEQLAHVKRDSPDREQRLKAFAATFAERAFRRPLTDDLRTLVVDRPFADAPDLDTALRRSLLATLGSPRFLFLDTGGDDPFATAARLSFGLWDSIPDRPLREAAGRGSVTTPDQIRGQAERMVQDRRTRAKIRDFLFSWLRVALGPEVRKDPRHEPDFSPDVAADLRTSLDLFLEEAVWQRGDFRRLFTDDEVHLNGRLAPLYGVALPSAAPFTRVRVDDGRRGGLLTHPYLMSVLSYPAATSPIHRGVFLTRTVLGNVLRSPQEAIAPLAPEQHPDLTTRERVVSQTSGVACQTCHAMINPLGFALEEFDAVGRHRTVENAGLSARAIDASGSYLSREGSLATFAGARELAAYVATSRDAQDAFVQSLFHALVKQPVPAWGPDTMETLRRSFAASGFDIRRLLVDIVVLAAAPPRTAAADKAPPETLP